MLIETRNFANLNYFAKKRHEKNYNSSYTQCFIWL